ncbi:MAG: glycosyltransferase family 2 protein [Planctomycetia bacterium]|nr:glycosyltransferase family 2 protein [Planctomycetia bacterium]
MFLSLIIPVYNEEESLALLVDQINETTARHSYENEIIFVDDGSKDASWLIISELSSRFSNIRAIRFRRNFGKAAALEAGFSEARGDFVLTMDADLQDDPAEIPHFLEKMGEGFDVVSGWKKVRHDPWHKVYPSRVFNWMASSLSGVRLHDHNCGMKCYRREVLDELTIFGERHRFLPILAGSRGFRVGEIVIQHRKREFGVSKYGFSRFLKGFMDLISVKFVTTYQQRPLHVFGIGGLLLALFGTLCLFASIVCFGILFGLPPAGCWSVLLSAFGFGAGLLAPVLLTIGGTFFGIGLAAELATAYHQRPEKSNFAVAERIASECIAAPHVAASAPAEESTNSPASSASS